MRFKQFLREKSRRILIKSFSKFFHIFNFRIFLLRFFNNKKTCNYVKKLKEIISTTNIFDEELETKKSSFDLLKNKKKSDSKISAIILTLDKNIDCKSFNKSTF